ncbi:hypothetical protein HX017_15595 [Myroides marinus]|uniref:Knr4/Smi1-like domain-containing protein n=1 Tax=Myroides marinus TaxID=703342 RepID=A0A1H6WTP0_9FLAO|nr:hypothetical protein [Myroides marinus]MDM1348342.1 hypothetical protein [Myroides marinus]MDM1351827.1 hypothetical protein [Myroides marinus]MDM1355444.1 hypothetical protein [Myroides marinus]MDM1359061.1 hypothetical protein [Myroides marinus]MDM1360470.1 hypothetical protein [Myroides marinus]
MTISLYTTGDVKQYTAQEIEAVKELKEYSIPIDYLLFLKTYGLGEINNLLMFNAPDKDYVKSTFSEYMDIWQWEKDDEQKALNSISIGSTIDGDVICLIDAEAPYMILPRHSERPIKLNSLAEVIVHYDKMYGLKGDYYFDSYDDWERLSFDDFIQFKERRMEVVEQMHQAFLKGYTFDKAYHTEEQPLYLIKEIGGWIRFDLVYGHSIQLKYQKRHAEKAVEVYDFLQEIMKLYIR